MLVRRNSRWSCLCSRPYRTLRGARRRRSRLPIGRDQSIHPPPSAAEHPVTERQSSTSSERGAQRSSPVQANLVRGALLYHLQAGEPMISVFNHVDDLVDIIPGGDLIVTARMRVRHASLGTATFYSSRVRPESPRWNCRGKRSVFAW